MYYILHIKYDQRRLQRRGFEAGIVEFAKGNYLDEMRPRTTSLTQVNFMPAALLSGTPLLRTWKVFHSVGLGCTVGLRTVAHM